MATLPPAEPSAPLPPKVARGEGSSIALGPGGKRLYVAGEDHHTLFWLELPLTAQSAPKSMELPGPPAQLVVAGDELWITIRNVPTERATAAWQEVRGPSPPPISPAPPRRKPFDKQTPKPDPRSNTRSKPLDAQTLRESTGGLLLGFTIADDGSPTELAKIPVPADAWGLAISADGKRAIVTSAFANAVTAFDLAERKLLGTVESAREPRGIVFSPDGETAYVSHLVGAEITKVTLPSGKPSLERLPFPTAPARTPHGATLGASLGYAPVLSPDAGRLFLPRHALGAGGTDAWWGAPTVDVLELETGKPLAPPREAASPTAYNAPPDQRRYASAAWLGLPGQPPPPDDDLVQPRAAVYRKSTNTLLVASEGGDTVRELDARAPDPAMFPVARWDTGISYDHFGGFVTEGGAPSGLALSLDEKTLYVFARSTFDVVSIVLAEGTPQKLADRGNSTVFEAPNDTGRVYVRLADDPLPFDASAGRRLFYNARDEIISGGLGCASCHPDGRDDGHVWIEFGPDKRRRFAGHRLGVELERTFAIDRDTPEQVTDAHPRQTPTIAGRVRAPGPYGWRGKNRTLLDRLLHGFELHRAPWDAPRGVGSDGTHVARVDMIADFAQSGLVPPPTMVKELSDSEKRGEKLFTGKAACATCHVAASEYTNRRVVPLAKLRAPSGFDEETNVAFKTPTLRFIANTAPYLHDGSAPTLEALIETNQDRMGKTKHLSAEERADLIAFLRTL